MVLQLGALGSHIEGHILLKTSDVFTATKDKKWAHTSVLINKNKASKWHESLSYWQLSQYPVAASHALPSWSSCAFQKAISHIIL